MLKKVRLAEQCCIGWIAGQRLETDTIFDLQENWYGGNGKETLDERTQRKNELDDYSCVKREYKEKLDDTVSGRRMRQNIAIEHGWQ